VPSHIARLWGIYLFGGRQSLDGLGVGPRQPPWAGSPTLLPAGSSDARLREVLTLQDSPTIVAGHSYGGQIMTALGTDAPNVVGLVYIAAFGIDEGESLGALLAQGPPTPATANLAITLGLRLATAGRLHQPLRR